jgi:ABC-type sulfate transport system permease subunit
MHRAQRYGAKSAIENLADLAPYLMMRLWRGARSALPAGESDFQYFNFFYVILPPLKWQYLYGARI